ncbi:MAG: hypothetical protein Q8L57_02430 [bacterium]|nr:hypothetical protein [bacterium]
MDFEQIKKLLELGGGKCAIYKEGEPGYVILTSEEFNKFSNNFKPSLNFEQTNKNQDFQIESLKEIKIDDLPI